MGGHLKSRRPEVRAAALRVLQQLPARACGMGAVSIVKDLAADSDARVRCDALKTLAVLAPQGRENLGIVAASAEHAAAFGSRLAPAPGLRPMRKAVSLAAISVLSGPGDSFRGQPTLGTGGVHA